MTSIKQNVVSALCKHLQVDPVSLLNQSMENLSVDPSAFASGPGSDLKSLCTSIIKSSQNGDEQLNNNELMKWIGFAEGFLDNPKSPFKALNDLNEELTTKSVLMGNGLTSSAADVIVFAAVHSYVIALSTSDRAKLPHLLRWFDYIQNKEKFGQLFEKVSIEKLSFTFPVVKPLKKVEDPNVKKTVEEPKEATKSETGSKGKKSNDSKVEESKASEEKKKKLPEKAPENKNDELSVSLLKIQIGLIRKAWKHPSADSLLVEEIDVGEAKCRQVVSGLAKFCTPEELTNRRVVLITNVKSGKLRDVMSEGLVLCASNKDHTVVEPLIAPDGAKLGECVTFSGHDGKPEEVLNPKKKQLDKITPLCNETVFPEII